MNTRRKNLLLLLPVLIGLLFLGPIGTVELAIWLVLVLTWLYAFFVWAAKRSPSRGDDARAN